MTDQPDDRGAIMVPTVLNTTEELIDRIMPVALARGGGDPRRTMAEALDLMAAETGDALMRNGAAIMAGRRSPGAPEIDDDAALAEIRERRAAGQSDALAVVARRLAEQEDADMRSVRRRLRRKLER
jgi:hypothetical protein